MGPNSLALMVICAVIAVLTPFAVAATWLFVKRQGRTWQVAAPLAVAVLISQFAFFGAVGIKVNREMGFAPTWGALFGEAQVAEGDAPKPMVPGFGPEPGAATATAGQSAAAAETAAPEPKVNVMLTAQPSEAAPRSFHKQVTGAKSGLVGNMYVWLPPQYEDPQYKDYVFPVVIAYPGIGISDANYWGPGGLNAEVSLPKALASGKSAPFIVVMPSTQFPGYADPECIDAPGGAAAWTWASQDVPEWIKANIERTSPRARDWSGFGFSVGGYCAVKVHLRHPEILGSGILFSGNPWAAGSGADPGVRKAFAADPNLRGEFTITDIKAAKPENVKVLLAEETSTGQGDLNKLLAVEAEAKEAGYGERVQVWNLGNIGHLPPVWGANTPKFLEWITTLMQS